MMNTYAIIKTGGKQYKVAAGDKIKVEKLDVAQGATVEFDEVLLIGDADATMIGTPTVAGARVTASCIGHDRADKVIVFKYKSKVRYRKKRGHRQPYSTLEIQDIVKPGGAVKKTRKKKEEAGGES